MAYTGRMLLMKLGVC